VTVTGGTYISRYSSDDGVLGRPLWTGKKRRDMDRRFCEALRKAIEAGQEQCTVGISTAAGTKFPVYYLPGDWG
jgi:hypothetical protein